MAAGGGCQIRGKRLLVELSQGEECAWTDEAGSGAYCDAREVETPSRWTEAEGPHALSLIESIDQGETKDCSVKTASWLARQWVLAWCCWYWAIGGVVFRRGALAVKRHFGSLVSPGAESAINWAFKNWDLKNWA